MTDEQTERLIAVLERIAAALEKQDAPDPDDVISRAVHEQAKQKPVQELSGVWHTPARPAARVIFR
jgi:hypothetical protein